MLTDDSGEEGKGGGVAVPTEDGSGGGTTLPVLGEASGVPLPPLTTLPVLSD